MQRSQSAPTVTLILSGSSVLGWNKTSEQRTRLPLRVRGSARTHRHTTQDAGVKFDLWLSEASSTRMTKITCRLFGDELAS